jgi:hypothetical protein
MKIDRINYTHTYQIGLTQWQKIGLEASIDDTEDPKECLAKLEQEAHDFHRKSNPSLYKNGNEALVEGFIPAEFETGKFIKPIPTINRKYDEMKAVIEDCGSLEELAKHKEYCGKHPDLMPFYMNKLKELTQIGV